MTQTLTPHIVVRDAIAMGDWYARGLGGRIGQPVTAPDGRVMSLEVRVGDAVIMICDEFPEMGIVSPKTLGGTYGALVLVSRNIDADWERALAEGAEVFHPLEDTSLGGRTGQFLDPSGHRWGLQAPPARRE